MRKAGWVLPETVHNSTVNEKHIFHSCAFDMGKLISEVFLIIYYSYDMKQIITMAAYWLQCRDKICHNTEEMTHYNVIL